MQIEEAEEIGDSNTYTCVGLNYGEFRT